MKTCTAFCFALLFLAGPLRSQHLQEFNIRDIRPGWSNRGISFAPHGDGVIAFISQDTSIWSNPFTRNFKTGLLAATLSPHGIADTMLLQTDGWFYEDDWFSSGAGYKPVIDASDHPTLYVRLEIVRFDQVPWGFFMSYRSRLLRLEGRTSTDILDIGNAHNARTFRTDGGGSRWFVWEACTPYDSDSTDGRYSATLKACQISPDGNVGDTVVIGSGYDPILLPDATGAVRLLYRNSWNSRSTDGLTLHTALLTTDGGVEDERTLLNGLRRDIVDPSFATALGPDNTIHILWPSPNSLQHFILGADAVLRPGLTTERRPYSGFTLKMTQDNQLVVLWQSDTGAGLSISKHGIDMLFSRVTRLPETAKVAQFSVESGTDGLMKVLYLKGRTIRVFRNPFASTPESVELVAFADSGIVPSTWVFASDGSLWLSAKDGFGHNLTVYRLASPQLGVEPPRPQSNPLHITGFSPHPVSTELRIGFLQHRPGNIEYFVFDVLGRLRAGGRAGYYREGVQAAQIQLPTLPPGAYVMRLRGDNAMAQRQFLVR